MYNLNLIPFAFGFAVWSTSSKFDLELQLSKNSITVDWEARQWQRSNLVNVPRVPPTFTPTRSRGEIFLSLHFYIVGFLLIYLLETISNCSYLKSKLFHKDFWCGSKLIILFACNRPESLTKCNADTEFKNFLMRK